MVAWACTLWAQVPGKDIPIYSPSYADRFLDNKTNPLICFDDAWQDSIGRLWLKTCAPVGLDRVFLVMFDGYTFSLVGGVMDSLLPDSQVRGKLREMEFFGTGKDQSQGHNRFSLFIVNLKTQKITFYPLSSTSLPKLTLALDNQTISSIYEEPGEWDIATISNGEMSVQKMDIPEPLETITDSDVERKILFFDREEIWWIERDHIRVVERGTGKQRAYSIPLQRDPKSGYWPSTDLVKVGSRFFIITFADSKGTELFWLDERQQAFVHTPGIPTTMNYCKVSGDQSDNALLVWRDNQMQTFARLLTPTGEWIDYSSFIAPLGSAIQRAVSESFRKNLVVCYSGGLLLSEVALTGAIEKSLQGVSIRAMTQLNDHLVWVTTQGNKDLLLDMLTLKAIPVKDTLRIGNKCFLSVGKEKWIPSPYGIYITQPDLSEPRLICPEIGKTNLVVKCTDQEYIAFTDDQALFIIDPRTFQSTPFMVGHQQLHLKGLVHQMFCDDGKILWIASSTGLWKINLVDKSC